MRRILMAPNGGATPLPLLYTYQGTWEPRQLEGLAWNDAPESMTAGLWGAATGGGELIAVGASNSNRPAIVVDGPDGLTQEYRSDRTDARLTAVARTADNRAWAVGAALVQNQDDIPGPPPIVYFDGSTWSPVDAPPESQGMSFSSIVTTSEGVIAFPNITQYPRDSGTEHYPPVFLGATPEPLDLPPTDDPEALIGVNATAVSPDGVVWMGGSSRGADSPTRSYLAQFACD